MSLAKTTLSETALVLSVVTAMVPVAAELVAAQPLATITTVITLGLDVTITNTVLTAVNTLAPVQVTVPPTPVGPVVIGMNTAAIVTS